MRSSRLAPILSLAALLAAAAPAAAFPTIQPQTLQCNGNYADGSYTHLNPAGPVPIAVQAHVQDTVGLRQGRARMGIVGAGFTRAIWRFDEAVTATQASCAASGTCPGTGHKCMTYNFSYQGANDPFAQNVVNTGSCVYDTTNCSTGTLVGAASTPPLGTGCPSAASAIPGSVTLFPADATVFGSYPGTDANATFNGSNQYGAVNYLAGLWDLNATYTLSAWFKTSANPASTNFRIASEQNGANYWGFGLATDGSGNLGVRRFDSRDTGLASRDQTAFTSVNLHDGGWHQIHVVRRDGIDVRYYVDGVLISTAVAASSDSFVGHPIAAPVNIGSYIGTGEFFNGSIDEIRVTDAALSDDDVFMEYNGSAWHKYSSNGGLSYTQVNGSMSPTTNATTAVSTYTPGGVYSASAQWIFEAQSTQTSSSVLTPFKPAVDASLPSMVTPAGAPIDVNDIQWSWSLPGTVCVAPGTGGGGPYFQLVDPVSGSVLTAAHAINYPTNNFTEAVPGTPNQLRARQLIVTDVWGTSALSPAATAYTMAAVPAGMTFASISTGGVVVSWNPTGNPAYTRYELSYARDPGFTVGVTTPASVNTNLTVSSAGIAGLALGTTYYLRLRAFNGRSTDPYGGVASAFSSTSSFVTETNAPTLAGSPDYSAPPGVPGVVWSWSLVPGATGYTLFDSPTQARLITGGGFSSFSSSTLLSPNTRYDAEVQADMPTPTPPSPRGHAFTYTFANPPASAALSAVFASSAVVAWSDNGNPPGTFYEVVVATDSGFNAVVSTVSVSTPNATLANLLPASTYYARVYGVNGVQIPTGVVALPKVVTAPDPRITFSTSPATPYAGGSGLVGAWMFDESTGTVSADATGQGDPMSLTCAYNACTSTPTWTTSLYGLGSAVSFNGLSGVGLSAATAPFHLTGSLSVEAWVNPATAAQQSGAGIVARGNDASEDFALDASGGFFRFIPEAGKLAASPTRLTPGAWAHVVGVYDSAAQTATLYVNGAPVAVTASVPVTRGDSAQPLAVGNRFSSLGVMSEAFAGSIDAVRVFGRALSAAEVLADFQGSFVSSVAAPAPNAGVIVALPPNAFGGAPAQILVTGDPVGHPIRVSGAALAAGLAALPSGLSMVPNSLVEVVPIVGGLPVTTPLGSSATLSIPFVDANHDGVVDGTNPPLSVAAIQMYTLNTTVNRWELLPTGVDPLAQRATGVTPHFSVFALFAPVTIGSSLSGVIVYPVPWKPGSGGRFDGPGVTFARLPTSGRIRILTLAGQRVREFAFSGAGAGVAVWDGTNDSGRRAASGVYFARIVSDGDGSKALIKFAIER